MKWFAMILLEAAAFWSRPASSDPAEKTDACIAFQQKVAATYNFDEARLSDEEKLVLEAKLDAFWTDFKAHQKSNCLVCAKYSKALKPTHFSALTAAIWSALGRY